jgi:CheY-like chemotaxis protein
VVLLTPAARSWLESLNELGFSGYLVKPVRLKSLLDRVRGKSEPAGHEPVGKDISAHDQFNAEDLNSVGVLKILLAEDNEINALLARQLLERRGHTVIVARSGEAAIAALRGERFDLLLTDLHMPGVDGIETARSVRSGESGHTGRSMPIVALTADALDATRQACQDAGMDGFLTKPIAPAELDSMITRLFSGNICVAAE